jgi:hypothetical protein
MMRKKKPVRPTPAPKPSKRPAPAVAAPRPAPTSVAVRMIDEPAPYAEVTIHEPITEQSMERLFQTSAVELLRLRPRRVLVDMTGTRVALSISDLNNLTKLVSGSFAGIVEKMAMVLRPEDTPPEKFFEPAMSNRGMPTFVSFDRSEAVDWLTARHTRPR